MQDANHNRREVISFDYRLNPELLQVVIDVFVHQHAPTPLGELPERRMRGERPFVFSNLKTGHGLDVIIDFIVRHGMLRAA